MKKIILVSALLFSGLFAQAQLRFGFTNPLSYDNWNNSDTSAGVEIAVWTPNNDTLKVQVGADVTAIDGNARNGFEYNFPPKKLLFEPGTNIYDSSNRVVLKYNFPPNATFFGERDFYVVLTNLVNVPPDNLLNNRNMIRVVIDYDGTNVGVKKLSLHSYRLYPIPTKGKLFVEGVNPTTYGIYDLSGRLVLEGDVLQNSIDVTSINNGLYILKAQTEKGLLMQKFLKD